MIITVSRQAATNGGLIGRLVAERLNMRVFDRELVDEVARRLHVEPNIVNPFDEATLSPVASMLWEWRTSVNEQIYGRYLRQALQRILSEDNAVIIGRGANFVLRCSRCLHVRIVAPLVLRSAIYRTIYDVTDQEARRLIQLEDHAKAQFVRTLFHVSIDDPEQYDMVLNVAGLTPEMATELIVHAATLRGSEQLPVEPHATLPQHIEVMARHRRPVRPEIVERNRRIA